MKTRLASVLFVLSAATAFLTAAPGDGAVIEDASRPALVRGPDGLGVVAYYDRANGDLKLAHCVDAACSAVTSVTVDATGDVGLAVALAVGPSGLAISYRDATNQDLKLALCADAACASPSIVVLDPDIGNAGRRTAVAFGTDGLPLVAYIAGLLAPYPKLKVAHCDDAASSAVTRRTIGSTTGFSTAIAIGGDGRAAILHTAVDVQFVHCADVACTSFTAQPASGERRLPRDGSEPPSPFLDLYPSAAVGSDGFVRYAAYDGSTGFTRLRVRRCLDALCAGSTFLDIPSSYDPSSLVIAADGFYRIALEDPLSSPAHPVLDTVRCLDADCATFQQSCTAGLGQYPSLILDGNGALLVAYERAGNVEVTTPGTSASCPPTIAIGDAAQQEGTGGTTYTMNFQLSIAPFPAVPVTVAYQTVPGTAQPNQDYVPASGVLTYLGGAQPHVDVTIVPDALPELDETFDVVLSAPTDAIVIDARGHGRIIDDEPPVVDVSGCATQEGDAGTSTCLLQVTLSEPPADFMAARVDFATSDLTATAGVDYQASSGALTFLPGVVTQSVAVPVIGDGAVELDETFALTLSNPVNLVPGTMSAVGTIVDDDTPSLSSLALAHGSTITADLAAQPGPVADQDFYHLSQSPLASYELVADAVSGDFAPGLVLERLAEDGSTVLQSASPVGTGAAVSLRWERRATGVEDRQQVRVRSAGCGTDCGADDTYRLRAYETTASIPRFNNAGTQVTVLLLQNPTDATITAHADFWNTIGVRVATQAVNLGPHALFVLDTSTVPALAGLDGSVTVTSDAPYGALAGKTVALEPATGLSFDSPLAYRAR